MDSELSPQFLARIAELSRLALGDAQRRALGDELGRILVTIETLAGCDTTGYEETQRAPTAGAAPRRGDVPAGSMTVAEALANAPDRLGDGFAVPAIMAAPTTASRQ